MDPLLLIDNYCQGNDELRRILVTHSKSVATKALEIAKQHNEMALDLDFIYEAAMLHDIGVVMCNAKDIYCFGDNPYICHGYLGADILRREGLEKHALVCERHTGVGLSSDYIKEKSLPLPLNRIYEPQSNEEKLICYADKFFSKTRLGEEKSIDRIRLSLSKFSPDSVAKFNALATLFK